MTLTKLEAINIEMSVDILWIIPVNGIVLARRIARVNTREIRMYIMGVSKL